MKLIITALLLTSSISMASGNRVGNGGDVIKCAKETKLLDLYESELAPRKFPAAKNYKDTVSEVLEGLHRVNPAQAKQYRARFAEMEKDMEFRPDVELTDIKDSKNVFKAKNCKLLQIAIRRNQVSTETKRFVIDEELWKELDDTNKAALILHEIIYEHFFKLGEDDSQKARILNAYLMSEKFTKEGAQEYWNLIKSLKVPIYQQ